MKRPRGRPRLFRGYDSQISVRLNIGQLRRLKLQWHQFCSQPSNDSKMPFNEFILKRLAV